LLLTKEVIETNVTTYGRGSDCERESYGGGYISKICSHCKKTRHTIDTCYRKHGSPPHSKFKN